VLSTGPPKEADSLGFEGSGLSRIGIPVLRGPSRSVGCRRSCGQPVTTSAILTSVNVAVKNRFTSTSVRAEYDEGSSTIRRQNIWATMSRRSATLSNANSDRTHPPPTANGDRGDDPARSPDGRTGPATDAIPCCFGRPPLAVGHDRVLEITSGFRRWPEAAN
jgi:hypothetical protein